MRRPILSRVIYRLIEAERGSLVDASQVEEADIDREVRLEFDDGSTLLASWLERQKVSPPLPARGRAPGPSAALVDMSRVDPWSAVVGQAVEITFADPESQVLEVRAAQGSVFLYSPENGQWHLDVESAAGLH